MKTFCSVPLLIATLLLMIGSGAVVAQQGMGGPSGAILFTEVTAPAGVSTSHSGTFLATGQGWADIDRDGDVDLYLSRCFQDNRLFLNHGDGTFVLAPTSDLVALPAAESGGVSFVDYDNDGWTDLYVLNRGPNVLFRNLRGAGWEDVTAAAGVGEIGEGESLAKGDFDGDGHVDFYVVNWYYGDDETDSRNGDVLYHNNGDGTFLDVSVYLDDSRRRGPGYAATFVDFDNDGDQDLYAVNDKEWGNVLWRNDGPGCQGWCFTDVSVSSGADRPVWGMGIATGDYDRDGDLDFLFSSLDEQVLLQNQTSQGSPSFIDVSKVAGVGFHAIGWSTDMVDFDSDGWLDFYVATMNAGNRVFRNRRNGTFEDVSAASGGDDPGPTIGAAHADYNGDGAVDLMIGNFNQEYRLYRNDTVTDDSAWLSLRLEGYGPVSRDAYGTRVYLTISTGEVLMREVPADSALGSSHDLALHFGLGTATVDSVRIVWPDGTEVVVDEVPVGRQWRIGYPDLVDLAFRDGFENGDFGSWSAATD